MSMVDQRKCHAFLEQRTGGSPWMVFHPNGFGYRDRDRELRIAGYLEEASQCDALVELLNAAPELLDEFGDLAVARNGMTVRRTARSLVQEVRDLRAALAEALRPDLSPTRRGELQKLL